MEHRRIARAALIIMLGNLATSMLGFVRSLVTAHNFGDSAGTDAWFAAYTVPQMFYDLIIGGAISAALIPSFTQLWEENKEVFWRVVMTVFALAAIVLVFMICVLEIAAHPLMSIIVSGFNLHGGNYRLNLSVKLVRIILPTLFFWGSSAVALAALYSMGKRVAASFATACFHLGIIISAVVLASPLGIIALPIGAVAGAAAQFLVQVPSLWRSRKEISDWTGRHLDFRDPHVRTILFLYMPVAGGIVVSIAGQIADINLKSHLPAHGDLSAMQFATTFIQFPVGIVVAALGLAVLPLISIDAAAGRMEDLKDKLALGFRVVLLIMVPAAVGFGTLGHQIVTLLFQHGQFSAKGTSRTFTALLGYAPQLPFIGFDQLLIFAFYARRNTLTPMVVGIVGVSVYVTIGVSLYLAGALSIFGLALANTIQISLHAVVLSVLLWRSIGTYGRRDVLRTAVKVSVAAAVMGLVVVVTVAALTAADFGRWTNLSAVVLPMLAAVLVYGGLVNLFHVEEVYLLKGFLLEKLGRTSKVENNTSSG